MNFPASIGWLGRVLQAVLNAPPTDPAPVTPPAVSKVEAKAHPHLTPRIMGELANHEAVVREAYKDSEGIWTWGIGVTSRSGHLVDRYIDNPQTLRRCFEVYGWLVRTRYLPDVLAAFRGYELKEHELAAALSFHYNTGKITLTEWVKLVKAGDSKGARKFLETHYLNGGDLKERRMKEAALFFDGKWSSTGKITEWPVRKPSYRPNWSAGVRRSIADDLILAMFE